MAEAPALRIHVLVERDGEVPLWAHDAIEILAACPQADVRLQWVDADAPTRAFGPWLRWWRAKIPALHPAQASGALEGRIAQATPEDGPPDVVLALHARTCAALGRLGQVATASTRHWLLGDSSGQACDADLPFFDAVTSGQGLPLHLWQRTSSGGIGQLVRKAHVPAPSRYGCALDSLGMHLGHLLRQGVTDAHLNVEPAATGPAAAGSARPATRPGEARVLLKAWQGTWPNGASSCRPSGYPNTGASASWTHRPARC